MSTVGQAFDSMGFTLKEDETVAISFGEERFKEYSLFDVADREIGANVYFSTGTFPVDTKWKKGARAFKNVMRILELPFDFDLQDFLNQEKEDIYDLSDDEINGYIKLLQQAVEDVFARISLPIHRLDCTGYGLSAHVVVPDHRQEDAEQIKKWHAGIVTRINGVYGDILADAQVKDAGSRIMRLIPCQNVGTRKDGSRVDPRSSYNVYIKPGYIDQARLETAAGALHWTGTQVDIPMTGDVLSTEQMQEIVDLYKPFHNQGQKHFMGLAIAGQLAKARIPEDQALAIIEAISEGDNKPWDRQKSVRNTYERVRSGQDVAGYSVLKTLVDEETIEQVDRKLEAVRRAQQPNIIMMGDHKKPGAFDETDIKSFNPPSLPLSAVYGWHRDWLDLVRPTTGASDAFHLAASTTFQAAMMGRRISVEYAGSTLYPNQFSFVIGRTKSFKDTAYRRTMEMMANAQKSAADNRALSAPSFKIEQDFASREALIETLSSTPNVYLFSTEVTTLLKNATREGTSTLLDALIQAWDNPTEISTNSIRARRDQSGSAAYPYLSLFGGSQPGRIADHMTETMISSGLGNRVAFFMGVKRDDLARTPRMDFDESVRMYNHIRQAINWYPEGTRLEMSDASNQMWDDWFYSRPEIDDEIAADISVRHPEMAQKWALMFAVSDQADAIEPQHLEAALILVDWMWECVQTMLPSWGVSNERKIEERIITVLQQRQPMTKRDLNRYVRGRWTAREFATVFRAMRDNHQISVDASDRYVALTESVLGDRGIA